MGHHLDEKIPNVFALKMLKEIKARDGKKLYIKKKRKAQQKRVQIKNRIIKKQKIKQ